MIGKISLVPSVARDVMILRDLPPEDKSSKRILGNVISDENGFKVRYNQLRLEFDIEDNTVVQIYFVYSFNNEVVARLKSNERISNGETLTVEYNEGLHTITVNI